MDADAKLLLPDRLRALWADVEHGRTSHAAATAEQERLLGELASEWRAALIDDAGDDLRRSLLREVADYHDVPDLGDVEQSFAGAVRTLREQWEGQVRSADRTSVERFYESGALIHDLMDWHSLRDDTGALAYVLALHIARDRGVRSGLDFGSGVGSGALLFSTAGIEMSLADVSSTLLDFCRWRYRRRGLAARFIDLKSEALPPASFDMVLAMDVFEHLVDPVEAVEAIHAALVPGGAFFARIHAEEDPERPQHIARDFAPTFARMEQLGLVQVWQDGWLWGHQLFEKRA